MGETHRYRDKRPTKKHAVRSCDQIYNSPSSCLLARSSHRSRLALSSRTAGASQASSGECLGPIRRRWARRAGKSAQLQSTARECSRVRRTRHRSVNVVTNLRKASAKHTNPSSASETRRNNFEWNWTHAVSTQSKRNHGKSTTTGRIPQKFYFRSSPRTWASEGRTAPVIKTCLVPIFMNSLCSSSSRGTW